MTKREAINLKAKARARYLQAKTKHARKVAWDNYLKADALCYRVAMGEISK